MFELMAASMFLSELIKDDLRTFLLVCKLLCLVLQTSLLQFLKIVENLRRLEDKLQELYQHNFIIFYRQVSQHSSLMTAQFYISLIKFDYEFAPLIHN